MSADKVVSKLIDKGWTISFAESCSGGMAAARLVSVPDASKVFAASVVTYANEAKVKYVDVNPQTIEHYGVVSEEVAMEMARGVAKANEAQVGVGISGIAGPTGATATKPVGMVCFGFVVGDKAFSRTCYFGNVGRDVVRRASVNYVYSVLEETLDIIGN
ncbi:MAG: CinA family protein [Lachnospiraceae bacterium]|nr:CinA family protein [Lachnospiraceae bacterium]